VIRIWLLEVANIIEVYSKAIVEYDCKRMRQNVCKLQNKAEKYSTERPKCLVTPVEM